MKTKNKNKLVAAMASALFLMAACSSSPNDAVTESTTRAITGNLSSTSTVGLSTSFLTRFAFAADVAAAECSADSIIATDVTGTTVVATVDSACDFTIDLELEQSYVISLTQDGAFVATLIFDSGLTGFTSSALTLSASDSAVDLGWITVNGTVATPENNPLSYCDKDDDGENDLVDSDDDEDGVADSEERDCDYDGFLDDDDGEYSDDHTDSCTAVDGEFITRVKPYDEGETIDLDKEIKIYTTCDIDEATVSDTTFAVVADSGETLACAFEVSSDDDHNELKCKHEETPFAADTVYTVTVDGLQCVGGDVIASAEWSFSTEVTDDDDGDYEDDFDVEDAEEGEDTEDHLEDDDADELETGDDDDDDVAGDDDDDDDDDDTL